eukprot:GFKZ01000428.1.p1 GENE.GFKZ01000428.1~~GFKZ01000428.1.p1  ORF type:complete len:960 (-),score=202.78 GFKZ01000428.1:110-2989(-)
MEGPQTPTPDPSMDTALDLFTRRCAHSQSTVLVFYRGERSFFCKQWLRRWLAIPAIDRRLELADVAILFVSSQSQGKAFSVAAQIAARRSALDHTVFFFGDPEHLLVSRIKSLGFAHPVVTNPDSHRAHGWVFDYGMVQPAILALAADGSVLYQWVSKPSLLNVAGKLDRPDPFDVWDTIERRLDRIRILKARAARAAASRRTTPVIDTDQAVVVTQPSVHSVGDVIRPAVEPEPDAREEKSDSELVASVPRIPSDRHIRKGKDRARGERKKERATQVGENGTPKRMESDGITAPLSTTIETLTAGAFADEKSLAKEEPDISDEDIASIPVKHLSSDINALATEVLMENTISLEQAVTLAAGKSIENVKAEPLASDFVDEFEDMGYSRVDTDGEESKTTPTEVEDGNAACMDVNGEDSSNDDFSVDEFDRLALGEDEFVGSTHSTRATSRVGSTTEPPTNPRFSDYFESEQRKDMQQSPLEVVETSVPSLGSDQVDSSLLNNRFGSVRTEDSSVVNTMQYDSRRFSLEREIAEEADDKKVGLSDYLRELKEPEKRHYRVRGVGGSGGVYSRSRLSEATAANSDSDRGEERSDQRKDSLRNSNERWLVGSTVGVNFANEVFRGGREQEDAESMRSMKGETDSPHPESSGGGGMVVDISPFADANHGMDKDVRKETGTGKGKLKDEYEAYDEYIVCEFEVEEYVEEYDSDTLSRSRVYVSGVVDEGSHDESTGKIARAIDVVNGEASGVNEVQTRERVDNGRKEVDALEKRMRGVLTEEGMRHVGGGTDNNGGGVLGVRWVMRRIRKSRRGGGHGDEQERVGRKDSLRMQKGDGEDDEARVGRKETLRAVLRRLPGSRRSQEGEDIRGYRGGGRGRGHGVGIDDTGCTGRRGGGLQAVLQRLPSLSGSARGRGRMEMEEIIAMENNDEGGEGVEGDDGDEGEKLERKRSVALLGASKTWRF